MAFFFKIPDIAKKSGMPESIILQVINSVEGIETEIKMKVFKAMKELSFELNRDRSSLEANTKIIALATSAIYTFPFPTMILQGIERKMEKKEYKMNQYVTESNHEYENIILTSVLEEIKPYGLICLFLKPDKKVLDAYRDAKIPAVIIDEEMEGYSSITNDNYRGGYIATEHLIKTGRKKICFVSGIRDIEGGYVSKMRFEGYKKALEDAGINLNAKNVFEVKGYTFDSGELALQKFHDSGVKFDAIFCAAGDLTAMGIIKKALELDISIPSDIAIVGYDNLEVGALTNPALTTIEQPIVEIGEKAFELVTLLRDEILKEPKYIKFEPKLIKRAST